MLRFSATSPASRLRYSPPRALTFRVLHYALLRSVRTLPRCAKRRGSSLDGAQMTHVSALDSATRGWAGGLVLQGRSAPSFTGKSRLRRFCGHQLRCRRQKAWFLPAALLFHSHHLPKQRRDRLRDLLARRASNQCLVDGAMQAAEHDHCGGERVLHMPRSCTHARTQQLDQVPDRQVLRNQLPIRPLAIVEQHIVRVQLEVRRDHALYPSRQLL